MIINKSYWKTAEGVKVELKSMDTDHILNCLAYLVDKKCKYQIVKMDMQVTIATMEAIDAALTVLDDELHSLSDELEQRANTARA